MLLYHYCRYNTFESILNSKSLWLTQIVKSNDAEEVLRTFDIIWPKIRVELVDKLVDKLKAEEILSILDNQFRLEGLISKNGDETPYGVCLSKNRDLSQNWNEYGAYGEGICLGFSTELFNGIERQFPHPNARFHPAIGWEQVIYDREKLTDEFISLFAEILNNDSTAMGWLTVRTTLKHYSAFIKNPTFVDEREVRIIYYPNESHAFDKKTELKLCVDADFPHCSLPWIKSNGECALKEVIVGNNCKYDCNDIQRLLLANGIKNVVVTKSEYPYRVSENR